MRLCANENFPRDAVSSLRQHGHDVLWILETAPGAPDSKVLRLAETGNRLLLTFDKDFGELVFRRGAAASCGIVLFRIRKPSPEIVAERVLDVLQSRDDWEGNFSVVEDATIRMRPLPT